MTDLSGGDYSQWWRMVIAGAGMGLVLGPISTDALNRAPSTSYGEVTGITQTSRNIGASVGHRDPRHDHDRAEQGQPRGRVRQARHPQGAGRRGRRLDDAAGRRQRRHERRWRQGARRSSMPCSPASPQTTQTIFYGMAIAMALAFIVTLVRLPRASHPQPRSSMIELNVRPAPTPLDSALRLLQRSHHVTAKSRLKPSHRSWWPASPRSPSPRRRSSPAPPRPPTPPSPSRAKARRPSRWEATRSTSRSHRRSPRRTCSTTAVSR